VSGGDGFKAVPATKGNEKPAQGEDAANIGDSGVGFPRTKNGPIPAERDRA
jgi:hypothetical protein